MRRHGYRFVGKAIETLSINLRINNRQDDTGYVFSMVPVVYSFEKIYNNLNYYNMRHG